jgi:hypothetical protein
MRRAAVSVWIAIIALAGCVSAFAESDDASDELPISEVDDADDGGDAEDDSAGGWLVPNTGLAGVGGGRGGTNVEHVDRDLIFRGVDLWWNGGFSHAGLLWSPDGLDREGFVLKSLIGAGSYRYRAGTDDIVGYHAVLSLMPGWRFKGNGFETSVFVGLDSQLHMLVPDDPTSRLRGLRVGSRLGLDVWLEPVPSAMINGFATLSTVGPSYAIRAAFGWRFFDWVYLGPEAQATGSTDYRQLRLGLHATSFAIGPYEFSAGAGYVRDSDQRTGLYGRFGVLTRR